MAFPYTYPTLLITLFLVDLLAISYSHIGPFKDDILTCFFDQGKYLIKAPIGSGKSFLFFDGPLFGLYKIANRNMLNAQSQEWYIKLLFQLNQEYYLVIRLLKAGKSKDSCSSLRYKVNLREEDFRSFKNQQGYALVQKAVDIEMLLRKMGVGFEELPFKNETDLQQNLQSILPPKEVFLNTSFLMQDSDNIFQLAPADRLQVLKNVFNLLAIDEGKDIIADKKREVSYKIKATADTSKYDSKFQSLLQHYKATYQQLQTFADYNDLDTKILQYPSLQAFLGDLDLFDGKITLTDFSLSSFPRDFLEVLDPWILSLLDLVSKKWQEKFALVQQLEQQKKHIQEHTSKMVSSEQKITQLDQAIVSSDPTKLPALQAQKWILLLQQAQIEEQIPHAALLNFSEHHSQEVDLSLQEHEGHVVLNSLSSFLTWLITRGKHAQEKIKNIDLQIHAQEVQLKQQWTILQQDITNIQEKLKDFNEQLLSLSNKITLFDTDIEHQASFDCEKIGTNCPFIKVINKQHFDKLDEQKKRFLLEQQTIQEKIQTTTALLQEKQGQLSVLALSPDDLHKQEVLKQDRVQLDSLMSTVRSFLQDIDYANIQRQIDSFIALDRQIKSIDKEIVALEDQLRQLEDLRKQQETLLVQIATLKEDLAKYAQQQVDQEAILVRIDEELLSLQPQRLHAIELLATTFREIDRDLSSLVHEFKDVQVELKSLQEEEKMLTELYTIFSKELLLLVLQDSLPVLNDIINNYLTQVVDYQVALWLEKTASDKLELAASIIDTKGKREIKSLSGGQMIILKLVRMLAISAYINSPLLFLDETINNLDAETVGKVADLLEDFVRQRSMKLYTVTHSQQIQDMDIRDAIIDISSL